MTSAAGLVTGKLSLRGDVERTWESRMAFLMFMPWMRLHQTQEFGKFRLVRYHRGLEPEAGLSGIPLDAIERVLDAYSARPFSSESKAIRAVDEAVLFDWCDEVPAVNWDDATLNARFAIANLVKFAAVAARDVGSAFDYCNASDVQVVAQRLCLDNPSPVTFKGRARGRFVLRHASRAAGEPLFVRPWQSSCGTLKLDEALLTSLLAIEDPDQQDRFGEAISFYLAANTDSDDVPLSAELVLLRMAMDRLMEISDRVDAFREALRTHFDSDLPRPPDWGSGPINEVKWRARWTDVKKISRPLDAWAHDFCNARNSSAHASAKPSKYPDSVMALEAHAVLASWLIPLMVKAELNKLSLYALNNEDRTMRSGLESLLSWDLLSQDGTGTGQGRFAALVDELKQNAIGLDLADVMQRRVGAALHR